MSRSDIGAQREAYILSLLAEGKYDAAYGVIEEFGSGKIYATDFSNHAHQLLESGQTEAAERLFGKAIALDGGLTSAHCGLGVLHLRKGNLGKALDLLTRAVNLDGVSHTAQAALGIILHKTGKTAAAIPHLVRALEQSPGLPVVAGLLQKIRQEIPRLAITAATKQELRAQVDQALKQYSQPTKQSSSRPTLSVCMIVKNEEANLARCLRSVEKAADEIVIVDTGSEDRTVEIAESFGAKVEHFAWCDDFAAARNYALSLATSDWILIMDADDEMDAGGDAALRMFLEGRPEAKVCSMRTRIPCPGGMETFIEHPRLFRNDLGLRYVSPIHEQLVTVDDTPASAQISCCISVYHHGYLAEEETTEKRRNRNLRILQRELERKPDSYLTHFFLGKEYRNFQQFEPAAKHFRIALDLLKKKPTSLLRMKAFSYLGEALVVIGQPQEAVRIYEAGLEAFADNPELLFGLGETKLALGDSEAAGDCFEAATHGRYGTVLANQDFLCRDMKPRIRLAEIALERNAVDEAEYHWQKAYAIRGNVTQLQALRSRIEEAKEKAHAAQEIGEKIEEYRAILERTPEDLNTYSNLVGALLALGRTAEAEREAKKARTIMPESVEVLGMHGVALVACERLEEAAEALKQAAEKLPGDALLLCDLGVVYSRLERIEAAREAFSRALCANKKCVTAYLGMGEIYTATDEFDKARDSYERALQVDPKCIDAWLGLGRTYLEKRALEPAIAAYQKAVEMSQGAPEVMAELAAARTRLAEIAQAASGSSAAQAEVSASI